MRKQILLICLVSVAFFIFAACQMEAELDLAEVKQAIEETNAKLSEAVANGDAEAFAACFTEDAQSNPPNAALISGRENIRASIEGMFADGFSGLELEVTEVSGSGDMVFETGTYKATVNPDGQEVMAFTDKGKYIVIWKRGSDGTWRLHRDIWNSNMALGLEISAKE